MGIIGGTGAGKSTLGQPAAPVLRRGTGGGAGRRPGCAGIPGLADLRKKIGFVPQQAELFSGTIAENIRWGDEGADDEAVEKAARMAQADEFIRRQKGGYQAVVERGGANLSGGQKQRLTIARALVRQPEILILDDASSALDYATDAALRRAIRTGTAGMTVFLISQRVSAIRQADCILVLDDGRLAGAGTARGTAQRL